MTGFRVGNPKRVRPFRTCAACGQERYIKSRNLCETCHKYITKAGHITDYPKTPMWNSTAKKYNRVDPEPARWDPHVCGCFSPINSGGYCLKCNKPVRR